MKRTLAVAFVLLASMAAFNFWQRPQIHIVHAQVATATGQTSAQNQYAPASITGSAGSVTNPSSNFVVNVAGGPIFSGGRIQTIPQATLTLSANTTNLLVFNRTVGLYAKQAVTGPGSNGTSQLNQPGNPTSLLFAIPGVEIPLATIVCGSTNCGNTVNGSITDARPLGVFPAGQYVGGHLNQSSAGTTTGGAGTMTATAGICTASAAATCIVTFSNPFQSTPVCTVTDQTTTANGALKALPTTINLSITSASSSDTFSYICAGNPN